MATTVRTKLIKDGESYLLLIPDEFLEQLDFDESTLFKVKMASDGASLTITPLPAGSQPDQPSQDSGLIPT